jgi:hypothetical protein
MGPLKQAAHYSWSTVGNNRQDPGPLFHLRHDKDVAHAETGGFRFQVCSPPSDLGLWRNLVSLELCLVLILVHILVGLAGIG